jgi:4-amino-4-deoxy-L-arabinose transferase-like glycosyltransferase
LLAAIAFFHAASIRPSNVAGDDYALYVHHAENIAQGRAYADTGYLYNPEVADYGPRSYPPVFPLFLAPVIKIWGLNFVAMKLEQVLFLVLALAAIYLCWRQELEFPWLLALVAILGFNPRFWVAKNNVLSDLPFLFFFYVAVLLIRGAPRDARNWPRWALLAGVGLYICVGTRAAGLTLIPSLGLYDLIKFRKISRFSVVTVFVCGVLLALQRYLIGPGQGSYLDQFHPTLSGTVENAASYMRALATLWLGQSRDPFSLGFLVIVALLACFGLYVHARQTKPWLELFLFPYLLLVVIWPSRQGLRFLFPVVPYIVYLAVLGLTRLSARLPRRIALAALAGFGMVTGFSYARTYRDPTFAAVRELDGLASFNDLCRSVRASTSPTDVFICRRPRALSLFTERSAGVYTTTTDADLWRFIDNIHATHILCSPIFENDRQFLIPFVRKYGANLELTYKNSDFELYRIRPLAQGSLPAPSSALQ